MRRQEDETVDAFVASCDRSISLSRYHLERIFADRHASPTSTASLRRLIRHLRETLATREAALAEEG